MSGFSGRWKLRNGKVAQIVLRHPGGGAEGKVEGMPETVAWDMDGNAVLAWTNREGTWQISNAYDLMERIREGAGQ